MATKAQLNDENKALKAELDKHYRKARRLATRIAVRNYPNDGKWLPGDDLGQVIYQLEKLTAGMSVKDGSPTEFEIVKEDCDSLRSDINDLFTAAANSFSLLDGAAQTLHDEMYRLGSKYQISKVSPYEGKGNVIEFPKFPKE